MPEIFNPNSGFFISGTNLDTTDRIKWGDVNIDLDEDEDEDNIQEYLEEQYGFEVESWEIIED